MKQAYMILRRPSGISRDTSIPRTRGLRNPFPGTPPGLEVGMPMATGVDGSSSTPASTPALEAEVRTDIDELTTQDAIRVAAEANVVAIAPDIPMTLIRPFDVAASEGSTWGITAVGADVSPLTGQDVVVAVLDTGIDAKHPAFSGVQIIQKDFTGEGDGDSNGHGTHCAGTIFGRDVEGKRIGVARGVTRALIGKVLGAGGGGGSIAINDAINWAVDNGANVISMSLGFDFPGYVARLENQGFPTKLAVSNALTGFRLNLNLFRELAGVVSARGQMQGRACVLIAAAGNESQRTDNPATSMVIGASLPAVADGFICVGALQRDGSQLRPASFSNTGVNVSAPGAEVLSAQAGGTGLVAMSGTSMATPHVAGVAALWAQLLRQSAMLTSSNLNVRLCGSCVTKGIQMGTNSADIGLGLVRAPQPLPQP